MTVCARLEVAFIWVYPIDLDVYPCSIFFDIESYESTGTFDSPCTKTPRFLSSLTFNPPYGLLFGFLSSKSVTFSM